MKRILLTLTALASLTITNYTYAGTEDYSRLSTFQIEQAAYNDAVTYLPAHFKLTEDDTSEIGSLRAHQHHLFGHAGMIYEVTFFQTLDSLIKSE